jgi:DNA-binding protein YbaB
MDGYRYHAGMFSDESASSALQRIDQWEQSMARRAEQARELTRRVAEVSATAHSRDGLVEVTVGPEGQIQHLSLDEQTRQQPAAATAEKILETLGDAQAKLIRRLDKVTVETVGADSETGRMLMDSLRRRLGIADGGSR